ncbi:AMP-binding protein [Streptomyces rhizosphaerihabitans]|uniref:AMP-binding protein n=1 Tax=Streptomyces rhizosphaerihabitans TaxID=1266770 RepID=UPI0021C214AC|nr:AMP-binding protein [Streptomyces rhizosphaerihabitans]MCT9008492.1 AMP-binding protein [Streptomyces rhizosphaerihabitans]
MSINGLYRNLPAYPDRRMRFFSVDGKSVTKTFPEVYDDVLRLMSELRDCGVGAGDLVGVAGPNSYEWVLADLALLGLECVVVALPVERQEEAAELAEEYQLSAVLLTKGPPVDSPLPDGVGLLEKRPLSFVKRVPSSGAGRPAPAEDVFSIAFSSGTSGSKKGLLMSKKGVENTMRTSAEAWEVNESDNLLIVMPFSNFQQRYLMYTAVRYGLDATVVAPERMFQKLKEFEPTIILGPPSFFEIAYNRVNSGSGRDRIPYFLAAALHRVAPGRASRRLRVRLGRKWMGMYGSRVRLMLTGSAPVPPRTVKLFQQLGAPLFEVYGSTEIGWISFNLPKRHRIRSAGRPVDRIRVEIGDDGEVVVATDQPQCLGYVFAGEETQSSVFLPGDRIATGDLGRFDRSGFLRLVGRKKNVIVTRSGVKINPEELELAVEKSCRIKKAMVASPGQEGRLTCVVWLGDWQSTERTAEVESYVSESNKKREASHRIAEVVFRPETELTVEDGLLTRNLKVDRSAVMRRIFSESTRAG